MPWQPLGGLPNYLAKQFRISRRRQQLHPRTVNMVLGSPVLTLMRLARLIRCYLSGNCYYYNARAQSKPISCNMLVLVGWGWGWGLPLFCCCCCCCCDRGVRVLSSLSGIGTHTHTRIGNVMACCMLQLYYAFINSRLVLYVYDVT